MECDTDLYVFQFNSLFDPESVFLLVKYLILVVGGMTNMCYGSHIESEHVEVILQLAQCPFAACVKHVRRKRIPSFACPPKKNR